MPDFEELKRRYMLTGGGGSLSPGPAIPIHQNCEVRPLLSGREYFAGIKAAIAPLASAECFLYIAGWWLDPAFSLDGPAAAARLTDLLIAKARAGVDVRVLGWVLAPDVLNSPLVASSGFAASILNLNSETMRFVNALRAEPRLAHKACLNILAHPAGSVHTKFAVLGNATQATAFTGGLDFQRGRHDASWHDVQAQVRGPAVQAVFEAFRSMWDEVKGRSPVRLTAKGVTADSHTSSTPALPSRTIASTSSARHHVQSVRTLPQYNFSTLARIGGAVIPGVPSLPTNDKLSYAPSGLFEIKSVWQKAISGAQTYVYIEDQAFTSGEIFDWINAAVRASTDLRVILLTGLIDPNDTPNDAMAKAMPDAVNNHLCRGLSAAQIDRIGLFSHKHKIVHAKTTIVDDNWALIGSANSMRRSLYTDFEHSVAFMDEADRTVREYRRDLWGPHLGAMPPTLPAAIAAWFAIPFAGTPGPAAAAAVVERLRLPLPPVTITSDERTLIDEVLDPDSRQAWGGGLASLAIRRGVGSMSGP